MHGTVYLSTENLFVSGVKFLLFISGNVFFYSRAIKGDKT